MLVYQRVPFFVYFFFTLIHASQVSRSSTRRFDSTTSTGRANSGSVEKVEKVNPTVSGMLGFFAVQQ